MAYATLADMELHFGRTELVELTNPTGEDPDTVIVDAALVDAQAVVDTHLAGAGYAVPLSDTPHILVRLTSNIARKYLYERDGNMPTEIVEKNHDNAIKTLEKIEKGQIELGRTEQGAVVADVDTVSVSAAPRVFSSSKLSEY